MKVKLQFSLLLVACYMWSMQTASAQFSLSAEVRPRAEYRHGFKKLIDTKTQDPAFFIEQRTRLVGEYKNSGMEFLFSLQDVRIWGSEQQIYKPSDGSATNFAAIHQAWGKYKFSDNWTIKIGRQELDYDNARFLGDLDWAQQARSHDAVLISYQDSTSTLHVGGAFNQDAQTPEFKKLTGTVYNQTDNYKTMQYLWYHKDFTGGGISGLFFNNGVQAFDAAGKGTTYFSQTLGIFSAFKTGKANLTTEAYYQFGKDPTGKKLSAALLAAATTLPISGKTNVTIGADYVSGTDLASTANHSFAPLYGTNHKFYGFMDYFYVGNPSAQMGKTVGLINPYLTFKFGLPKGALLASLHHFRSPVTIYKDPEQQTGDISSALGNEVDLVYNLNLAQNINLKIGYSQLLATEAMQLLKSGSKDNLQCWAWTMITFKPTFFQTEK